METSFGSFMCIISIDNCSTQWDPARIYVELLPLAQVHGWAADRSQCMSHMGEKLALERHTRHGRCLYCFFWPEPVAFRRVFNLRADALTAAYSGNNQRGRPTTGSKAAQPVTDWC